MTLDEVRAAFQGLTEREQLDFKAGLEGHPPMTDQQWARWQLEGRLRRAGAGVRVRLGYGHVYYDGETPLTDFEGDDYTGPEPTRFVLLPAGVAFLAEHERGEVMGACRFCQTLDSECMAGIRNRDVTCCADCTHTRASAPAA